MISQHARVYLLAGIMVAATIALGTAYASTALEVEKVPRYGEECAHGHNGFDCKPSQYRSDIDDLQRDTSELQKRVSALERYHNST